MVLYEVTSNWHFEVSYCYCVKEMLTIGSVTSADKIRYDELYKANATSGMVLSAIQRFFF